MSGDQDKQIATGCAALVILMLVGSTGAAFGLFVGYLLWG